MKTDARTAERIGLDWLRAAAAPASEPGRRAEEAAALFGPGDEAAARAACALVAGLAQRLAPAGVARARAVLYRLHDPGAIVERARLGEPPEDVDLFALGEFAAVLDELAGAWREAGGDAAAAALDVRPLRDLLAPGRRAGGFYLDDAFDAELTALRAAFAAADGAAAAERARLAAALAPALGFVPDGEEFIVMRDAVPGVPPGAHVVRETPAYRTLSVALDAAARAREADRDAALAALAAREAAVRRRLGEGVARFAAGIRSATANAAALDRTLARVAFTQRWGGAVPDIAEDRLAFEEATFAPLADALARAGRAYTPISLELRAAAVLTGPNMGGKSAALATCGFIAACVACGIPPPARAASVPLLATAAWIGGAAEATHARLLSAFGEEVLRAREVLSAAGRPALVLIDEFARTTGPREGRALLSALVEAFARRGAFALVATHLDRVAAAAGVAHFAIAGLHGRALPAEPDAGVDAALDAVGRAMDYRIGRADAAGPGESDAVALAAALGLDAAVVERARALLREEAL